MYRIYGCGYSTLACIYPRDAFNLFIHDGPIRNWRSMKIEYRSATSVHYDWEESLEKHCMNCKGYLDLILNELEGMSLPNWSKEGF